MIRESGGATTPAPSSPHWTESRVLLPQWTKKKVVTEKALSLSLGSFKPPPASLPASVTRARSAGGSEINGAEIAIVDEQDSSAENTPQIQTHNSSLYKTEMCRSFDETGFCRYGVKCRFAHGDIDRRVITRHKKYKTERCVNFVKTGVCPYGQRCRFIHNPNETNVNTLGSESNRRQSESSVSSPYMTSVNADGKHGNIDSLTPMLTPLCPAWPFDPFSTEASDSVNSAIGGSSDEYHGHSYVQYGGPTSPTILASMSMNSGRDSNNTSSSISSNNRDGNTAMSSSSSRINSNSSSTNTSTSASNSTTKNNSLPPSPSFVEHPGKTRSDFLPHAPSVSSQQKHSQQGNHLSVHQLGGGALHIPEMVLSANRLQFSSSMRSPQSNGPSASITTAHSYSSTYDDVGPAAPGSGYSPRHQNSGDTANNSPDALNLHHSILGLYVDANTASYMNAHQYGHTNRRFGNGPSNRFSSGQSVQPFMLSKMVPAETSTSTSNSSSSVSSPSLRGLGAIVANEPFVDLLPNLLLSHDNATSTYVSTTSAPDSPSILGGPLQESFSPCSSNVGFSASDPVRIPTDAALGKVRSYFTNNSGHSSPHSLPIRQSSMLSMASSASPPTPSRLSSGPSSPAVESLNVFKPRRLPVFSTLQNGVDNVAPAYQLASAAAMTTTTTTTPPSASVSPLLPFEELE